MRKTINYLFLLNALFSSLIAISQQKEEYKLLLQKQAFTPSANLTAETVKNYNTGAAKAWGKSYCILQFERIPLQNELTELKEAGVELLEYIPEKAYVAAVEKPLEQFSLKSSGVRSIIPINPAYKTGIEPAKLQNKNSILELSVSIYRSTSPDSCISRLMKLGYEIISADKKEYFVFELKIAVSKIPELISLPFIKYIELKPEVPVNFNKGSLNNSRGNVLQSKLPGGYNLSGKGITIAVNELVGPPFFHPDFEDRLVRNVAVNDAHSTHVTGIAAGAGNINELYKGYAPKAKIYNGTSNDFFLLPTLYRNYGAVISNNSYGPALHAISQTM
jgi:hypothetical protein